MTRGKCRRGSALRALPYVDRLKNVRPVDVNDVRLEIAFLLAAVGAHGALELRVLAALLTQVQVKVAPPAVHLSTLRARVRAR